MCELYFFPAALQKKKKLLWKDIKNTNEKEVLLTCLLKIKVAASNRTWIRFLQMPVFAEMSFCFRQDFWCQEENCAHIPGKLKTTCPPYHRHLFVAVKWS